MPDTRRAERVLLKWLDSQTVLCALAGVLVADGCLPMAGSLRGRLEFLSNENVLILKSDVGSFLNIASWRNAKLVEVKSDWKGTMIEVSFAHEILIIADFEPPSDFFAVSKPKSGQRKNRVFPVQTSRR
ncbi:MAG: hypothetical protein QOC81_3351 [Thermoanaerobaculia bacterium]|jgi:hypothetical protein|nr:hypothetical protein [Thermoanaerobaculia bacterium]